MFSACKSKLAAVCILTAFAFLAQMSICLAERANILPCHENAAQQDAGDQSGKPASHCCHCGCHGVFLNIDFAGVTVGDVLAGVFFNADDFAPEAPVQEIDYPPQLS